LNTTDLDYIRIALSGTITEELWTEKYPEGSGAGLIEETTPVFALMD
jgi:hypothetical protein